MRSGLVAFAASLACQASSSSFKVAEVKPHFGCTSADGRDQVRQYVADLAEKGTGLIALIEMEFSLPQPAGYTAFGASCLTKHADPTVVLVDTSQFSVVATIGGTVSGNFSAMPFLADGTEPDTGDMCVANASAMYGPDLAYRIGARPYTGAVLRHSSGKELCVIAATFPHCMQPWLPQFISDIEEGCGDRQLLFVVDTNAGCEIPSAAEDARIWSMAAIARNHSADWGECHDPAQQFGEATCCNDFPDFPYARYAYDRTAVCRGGAVEDFEVESTFVCGNSRAEHKFTSATVHLAEAGGEFCLDNPACASVSTEDGRCCPASNGARHACCDAAVSV